MRIAVIFGTRPEAIKLAPVILRLKSQEGIDCRVCVTAQRRGLLDQVLQVFDVRPDRDLNLIRPDQPLASESWHARELAASFRDAKFVYPVHPNRSVRRVVQEVPGDARNRESSLPNV
jgi:UDP-N-acetylglucosamine 2-epimerase